MAENEKEKVSFSLEMTDGIQNESFSNFFISGPIDIFATVDNFEELYSEEIKTAIKEALESDPELSINVFVKNTFCESGPQYKPGNLFYRGSYYQLVKFDDEIEWQEVAIGTHVHDNKEILDKIPVLSASDLPEGESLIAVRKNGDSFDFTLADGRMLPSLPEYIQAIIDKNKEFNEIPVYDEGTIHHLDAAIDELTWVSNPEDPEHPAHVYGHCQSLFDAIYKLNERLFLERDSEEITISSKGALKIKTFNISGVTEIPYFQEISLREKSLLKDEFSINPLRPDYIYTNIENFELHKEKGDFVVVSLNEEILSPNQYTASYSDNELMVIFPKTIELNEEGENLLTIIKVKNLENRPDEDRITFEEFIMNVFNKNISIDDIKNALFNIYIKKKVTENRNVPKMYLSIDEEGNPVWDNKLLPANTFKFNKAEFNYEGLEHIAHTFADGRIEDAVKVTIENVIYDGNSFPIIMFDNMYVFDSEFSIDAGKMSIWIPTDRPYFDESMEKFTVSVLSIFNGAGAILENLASDYVSKTELLRILTRGKVDLKHYAKAEELRKKADLFHTHSAYANADHTHDFRYADYHHTHATYLTKAEYWASNNIDEANQLTSISVSTMIDNLIRDAFESESGYFTQIKNLLVNDCGFTNDNGRYYFSIRNAYIDDALDDAGVRILEYMESEQPVRVDEVLARIINDLRTRISNTSDIKIGKDIVATIDIGGIKAGDIIDADLTLEEFVEDLVYPYVSAEERLRQITPVELKPNFYRNRGTEENPNFVKIEAFDAALDDVDKLEAETLYIGLDEYLNADKEVIKYNLKEIIDEITLEMDLEEKIFDAIISDGKLYLKIENITKMDHVFRIHIPFEEILTTDNRGTAGLSVSATPVIDQTISLKAVKAVYIMGNLYKDETIKDDRFSSMLKVYDYEIPEVIEDYVNSIFDYYVIAYSPEVISPRDIRHESMSILEQFESDTQLWDNSDAKIYGDDYDYIYFRIRKGPNKAEKAKIKIVLKEDAE